MPSSIIITGGQGFVGKHLVTELLGTRPDIKLIVWDRSTKDLPGAVTGLDMDITIADTYLANLRAVQPAWLIHLAAIAPVGTSFEQPDLIQKVNVDGTRLLLEAVKQVSPHTIVIAVSSADIYGHGSAAPLAELPLDQAHPRNPYAASKLEVEKMIEQSFNDFVIRVRPFPHIGPGQKTGFVTADFASQIASIEKGLQPPVMSVGNLKAKRDFTDVRDVVRAYRLLLDKGSIGQVYHVASGAAVAIQHILNELLKLSPEDIEVKTDPKLMRPADIPILVGSAAKIKQATGWQATIPLAQSLKDILDWWRQQKN